MTDTLSLEKQKKLGLALSGGGARGFAHIGVLKVLTEENIQVSCLSGTSMGGLVGTLYAIGYTAKEIEKIAIKHTTLREMINLVDRTPHRRGLILGQRLRNLFAQLIGKDTSFSDTLIPLALNGVDLITSQEAVLTEGNLLDAVMSTIAIPGFFAPVKIGKMQLIDGGTLNNLPVKNLKVFAPEVVMAVDVHPDTTREVPWQFSDQKARFPLPVPDFFLDFYRAELIMITKLTELNLQQDGPDLLIRPKLPPEITMFYGYQKA
ncbi:MAG: patatin-like phospholipase family protein, partial [Anaerolineae bacterium]|nr:patatin-like phospholipase family protein [Anaerolineae bacterium]